VAEVGEDALVVHDATCEDPTPAFALSRLSSQDLTHCVTGVFRSVNRPVYDDQVRAQIDRARSADPADLQALLTGKDTWTVRG
jgi:2-oxoglutarate ferredoxin oxidoreductase subunit beta